MGAAKTDPRIRWVGSELMKIEDKAKSLMTAHPTMPLHKIVREAQLILPKNRQRDLQTLTHIPTPLRAALIEYQKHPAEVKPEAPPAQPGIADALQNFLVSALVDAAKHLMQDQNFRGLLLQAVAKGSAPASGTNGNGHHPPNFSAPSKRQPRLLLAGIKQANRTPFEAKFPGLRFTYWDNGSLHLLRDQAAAADHVIYMARSNGHQAWNIIKAAGAPVVRVGGSQTMAIGAVQKILSEWNQQPTQH